jgi:hypothetical protein
MKRLQAAKIGIPSINCYFRDKGIFFLHDEETKEATNLYNGSHIPDNYDIVEKK